MKFFLFVFCLLIVFDISAQNKKYYWGISPALSHYNQFKSGELNLGDIPYNICPSLELLYNYQTSSLFCLKAGLSYQYTNLISHVETSDKFKFGEISIPIIASIWDRRDRFSIDCGLYTGKFLHFSWFRENHTQWVKVGSNSSRVAYKNSNIFADLYLAFSIKVNSKRNSSTLISPFVKYRFAENWMEHYRESSQYGIKFTVILNKNNND